MAGMVLHQGQSMWVTIDGSESFGADRHSVGWFPMCFSVAEVGDVEVVAQRGEVR